MSAHRRWGWWWWWCSWLRHRTRHSTLLHYISFMTKHSLIIWKKCKPIVTRNNFHKKFWTKKGELLKKSQQSNYYWKDWNYWKRIITEEIDLLKELQLLNCLKLLTNQTTQKNTKKKRKTYVSVHTWGGGGGGGAAAAAGCAVELDAAPFCITSAPRPNIP